jgi:hypothetical protein
MWGCADIMSWPGGLKSPPMPGSRNRKQSAKRVMSRRDLTASAKLVYVVLCEKNHRHITDLIRATGLGRATCYHANQELKAHHLVWFPERGIVARH